LDRYASERSRCEVVESLIEAYASDERFDLVLCEGTIPGQLDPVAFARRIGRFAAPSGALVVTTQDAASSLAELVRRLVAAHVVSRERPVAEQLERLKPIFAPHLATLEGMSRPLEDWILDNIVQPYHGELFPLATAIDALRADGFEVYETSPRFFTDWRWYKKIVGLERDLGPLVRDAYLSNLINMMDHRLNGSASHSVELGTQVLGTATEFYRALQSAEHANASYHPALGRLREIAALVHQVSPLTAAAIDEALGLCAAQGGRTEQSGPFASFFGHGQQYVSFIRRAPMRGGPSRPEPAASDRPSSVSKPEER
jgi:hypothetical protein